MESKDRTDEATSLVSAGVASLIGGEAGEAVSVLAKATQLVVELFGHDAPECFQAHLEYGRALLELARLEPQVLGVAMEGIDGEALCDENEEEEEEEEKEEEGKEEEKKTKEEGDDEMEDGLDAEKVAEMVEDALAENAEALEATEKKEKDQPTSEEANVPEDPSDAKANAAEEKPSEETETEEKKMEEEDKKEEEKEDKNEEGEEKEVEEEEVDEDGEEEEDEDEPSNLQLAWEVLEVARMIASRQEGAEWREREMETRALLGQVQIDDEKYEGALADLDAVLSIQSQLFEETDDRRLAETHFQMARAHNLANDFDSAASSYNKALSLIQARLDRLAGSGGAASEKELEDLRSLIPEIQAKVEDALESAASLAEKLNSVRAELGLPTTTVGFKGKEKEDLEPASDIAHLIRKPLKRGQPEEDPTQEPAEAKKTKIQASPQKPPLAEATN